MQKKEFVRDLEKYIKARRRPADFTFEDFKAFASKLIVVDLDETGIKRRVRQTKNLIKQAVSILK